jgi:hypothetical protein
MSRRFVAPSKQKTVTVSPVLIQSTWNLSFLLCFPNLFFNVLNYFSSFFISFFSSSSFPPSPFFLFMSSSSSSPSSLLSLPCPPFPSILLFSPSYFCFFNSMVCRSETPYNLRISYFPIFPAIHTSSANRIIRQ